MNIYIPDAQSKMHDVLCFVNCEVPVGMVIF
jgi:hypothetical protein